MLFASIFVLSREMALLLAGTVNFHEFCGFPLYTLLFQL